MRVFNLLFFTFAAIAPVRATLPPLPQPATSFGAAVLDGHLYIYGGNRGKAHEFHRECIRGEFFRLKLAGDARWESLGADTPLLGSAMAAHGGYIYRIGGMMARNAKGEENDIHSTNHAVRFSPDKQRWEALPSLPENRSSHDVAVLDDVLYVGGGWKLSGGGGGRSEDSEGEWHKTLLLLNLKAPEQGWKSEPQPFQRRALAVVAHEGRIWFLGGMDQDDDPSREVDWFDPKTREWGKGPKLPEGSMAGFGMAACSVNGKLLASPLSGKLYALSADGAKWEEAGKLERPRFFHRLLPVDGGRLVAVGGSDRKGQIREPEFIALKELGEETAVETKESAGTGTTETKSTEVSEKGLGAWAQWRGPNRDGLSPETNWRKNWSEEPPKEIWRAQIGAGMSTPVLAAGRLVTQGNDGKGTDTVWALDAATGAVLWRHNFPCASSPHEMPMVPPGPGATPTIVDDRVFALSREGDLLCLDLTTGKRIWGKNVVRDFGGKRPVYGYTQSPLVLGNRAFVDAGAAPDREGSTVAVRVDNGEVLWRAGRGEAGYSSARVLERDGRTFVAMFKGEALDVFDPADGKLVWSHKLTARDFSNAATPAFAGHRILVSNTSTEPAALLDWDVAGDANVRAQWTHRQFALIFNSAILLDGAFFGFNEKRRGHHEFTCIDVATGQTRWVSDAVQTGTFILADGHWIFLSRDGEVVLAPAKGSELKPTARFAALEGKCYATPTLADGRLYVRSNSGELVCYDVRPSASTKTAAR